MKPILILASFFLSTSIAFTQSDRVDNRVFFGGPSFANTSLAGDWTMEIGGFGARFMNEQLYLGGGGFALSQETDDYHYEMAYGGLMLGYFWQGGERTALNFYAFIGYGSIQEDSELVKKNSQDFCAIRPAVEVDFLLADWMRLGIGGGYRGA